MHRVFEQEILNANDIPICILKAELIHDTITVYPHTCEWKKGEIGDTISFRNGLITDDAENNTVSIVSDFVGVTDRIDILAVVQCVAEFYDQIRETAWYVGPFRSDADPIYYFAKKGGLLVKDVSEKIMSMYIFITFDDTEEIYYYQNGIYLPSGEKIIIKAVQEMLKNYVRSTHKNEVMAYIRTRTYVNRKNIYNGSRYVNLENGVYDRQKKMLLDHDPSRIFTSQIPVAYDEDATCPRIVKFLDEVLQKDDIQCVLEFFGYCLIPSAHLQKAMMLTGIGANGKSVLLNLLTMFIGHDNTSRESLQQLEEDKFSMAELYQKHVNAFPDIPSSAMYENSVFKMLTGDETELRAQRKFQHPFKFKNTAKLIFSANQMPPVPNGDHAYFRRWLLIEFLQVFDEDRRDIDLINKLTAPSELEGLLQLSLKALDVLEKNGRFTTRYHTDDIEKMYRLKSDPIGLFVEECVAFSDDDTDKADMLQHLVKWCTIKGIKPMSAEALGKRLMKMSFKSRATRFNGIYRRVWENCSLKPIVLDSTTINKFLE